MIERNPVLALTDLTSGVSFNVRLEDGNVAVYDARWIGERHPDSPGYEHTTLGQKVSWISTGGIFKQGYRGAGWAMVASEPSWILDARSIRLIADWLLKVSF